MARCPHLYIINYPILKKFETTLGNDVFSPLKRRKFYLLLEMLVFFFLYLIISEGTVIEITDQTINDLSTGEWLLEIYAPWCSYCKQFTPTWDRLGETLSIKVARLDGSAFPDISFRFAIVGYPSIYHIKDGEVTDYGEGSRDYDTLKVFAADRGYKLLQPTPWYFSPLGTVGEFYGSFYKLGSQVDGYYNIWTKNYEFSDWSFLVALFLTFFSATVLFISFVWYIIRSLIFRGPPGPQPTKENKVTHKKKVE